jgi:hypothetical protein
MNGYQYRCIASNNDGNDTSNSATLSTDIEAPVTPNLTTLTGECAVTATAPSATDNCSGTVTGTTTDPTVFNDQGNYTITWTFADGNGNSTSADQTVIVEDITDPEVTCLGTQNVIPQGANGYSVQGTEFDPISTSDNCDVAFIENDFNNTTTLENAQFPEGMTTINWTVTDVAGNTSSCSFVVNVNTFVGIEALENNGISAYPNPTNGIVKMDFGDNNISKVTVLDNLGKIIVEKTEIEKIEQINLSGFQNGVYIIRILTDHKLLNMKIVKQ